MSYIYTEAEISVSDALEQIDTADLLAEIQKRSSSGLGQDADRADALQLLEQIYYYKRCGQDYTLLLDQLIYLTLGRL